MKNYTVKEIAELLNVSKTTIQRAIKAASIEAAREETQTRYYSPRNVVRIGEIVNPDIDIAACIGYDTIENEIEPPKQTATEPQQTEPQTATEPQREAVQTAIPQQVPQQTTTKSEQTEPQTAAPQQTETRQERGELELLRGVIATLQKQLEVKDEQIKDYSERLEELSNRLKEAMELTKGQQFLSAADKQVELLEASEKEVAADQQPQEPEKKKGFLSRWFGL